MKKKIFGAAVMIVRHRRRAGRGRDPGRVGYRVPGARPRDHRQAEAYASADPIAEKGMQEAVRRCMAKAGFDYTPPSSDDDDGPQRGHRIQTAHGRGRQSQRLCQHPDRKDPVSRLPSPRTANSLPIRPSPRHSPGPATPGQ